MNRSKSRFTPFSSRTSLAHVVRLPRRWWRVYADWRIVMAVAVALAFVGMILLPTGVAFAFKRQTVTPSIQGWLNAADEQVAIPVYQMQTGQVVQMPLGDYVMDVLAAELPPSASKPALEAAAIAARTYAVRSMAITPPKSLAQTHHAAVTDSSALDLPLETETEQDARFGDRVNDARVRYQAAILATDGKILTYEGKPILAFSFALSPGSTRSSATVFGQNVPYLQPVVCPDDALVAVQPVQMFDHATLTHALHVKVTVDTLSSFKVVSSDATGFVNSVQGPGLSHWTGAAFAAALGLKSGDFSLAVDHGQLAVTCRGIGSDVGLSLHEASAMAAQGQSVQQILNTFYPGAQLAPDSTWVAQ